MAKTYEFDGEVFPTKKEFRKHLKQTANILESTIEEHQDQIVALKKHISWCKEDLERVKLELAGL